MSDYYPDLQGWLSREEGEELQRLVRNKKVLEIGCWKARSTIIMAEVAEQVVSIDHFNGDNYTGPAYTFPEALENIRKYRMQDRIALVVCDWRKALPFLSMNLFDFVFYDAGHDYQVTSDALRQIHLNLVSWETIAVHDYRPEEKMWEPTVKAVNDFLKEFDRKLRVVDSLAILE